MYFIYFILYFQVQDNIYKRLLFDSGDMSIKEWFIEDTTRWHY